MSVTQTNVFPDVFRTFYDLINSYVADPLDRNKQWIFSSFPEEDIAEGKVKYPIIIIEPADMAWETLTMLKNWNMIELTLNAYSTRLDQADSLLAQINSTLDAQRNNLKCEANIHFLKLERTSTDFSMMGGTRTHVRTAMYSMRNPFVTGLAKVSRSTTTTSDAVIN